MFDFSTSVPAQVLDALELGDQPTEAELATTAEIREIKSLLNKFYREYLKRKDQDTLFFADQHERQDFHSNLAKSSYGLITGDNDINLLIRCLGW